MYFPILRLTFLGTLLILGRAIVAPGLEKATPYTFPEQVALSRSQFIDRTAIVSKSFNPKYWSNLEGYQYNYQGFNVKVHYLRETDGDISTYLDNYGLNNQKVKLNTIDKQGQSGFYRLFEHNQVAYLTACINPRGGSTVNREQFFANRNAHDLKLDRVVPIILGMADPRDARCLWVTVSAPIENQSIDTAHQQLEAAWQEIYAWWFPKFPKV
ncbi:cyanoexosortase A system-associated protein [Pseudanabaenaceae cyanobacterium LEGE 13415]|nr:cyanoexosortase A system-associated protein [Pseudanabaenaceae cyanobacterium LEGE 13415]